MFGDTKSVSVESNMQNADIESKSKRRMSKFAQKHTGLGISFDGDSISGADSAS